jgi:LacI family transcriptional regulator
MSQPVAIVMTEVFLRRLTPSLASFAGRVQDYRILSIHRKLEELEGLIKQINPRGLILERLPNRKELLELAGNVPTILLATDEQHEGCVSLDVDDWAVGKEAADAFSSVGFKSIACLGNGTPYSDQRIEGFTRASNHLDVPLSIFNEEGFEDSRYSESFRPPSKKLQQWLQKLPKPAGVFAVHDPLGRFLCGTCSQLGMEIPHDIAVIGANDDPLVCNLTYPTLSSVSIPWDALGERLGSEMDALLKTSQSSSKLIRIPPTGVSLRHSANHLAVEDPILRRAMSYLNERMQEAISVGLMCYDLKIARRTLERRFKEYFKTTPWEMLCRMRVNRARQMLAETNYPIALVAELCGFNDAERMSVVFNRVLGSSPSVYRKSIRAGMG